MVETNIETIVIPELNIALTTSKKYEKNNTKLFNFDGFMDRDVLEGYKDNLEEDKKLVDELLEKRLTNIGTDKKEHELLETFYVPNMRFEENDVFREEIIERIMKYAKEVKKNKSHYKNTSKNAGIFIVWQISTR